MKKLLASLLAVVFGSALCVSAFAQTATPSTTPPSSTHHHHKHHKHHHHHHQQTT
ncbi:MAG TPA: hypothetical protein VEG30_19100 [Terriglobales bacterium]|nr:hypothetical protein [Terriglobales bacterium]